jgi:uncharacterized heparinase superfamily protein
VPFSFSKLSLLLHTLRHLSPVQWRGQIVHRLRQKFERPQKFTEQLQPGAVPFDSLTKACLSVVKPRRHEGEQRKLTGGEFTFLNSTRQLGWPPAEPPQDVPKLWKYHLHYHDWLWSLSFAEAKAAVENWIQFFPLEKHSDAWESYPIALRVVNWTALFRGKWIEEVDQDGKFVQKIWTSLYTQIEWLIKHLEYHLMGNHLLEDGCTLAFVASVFDKDGKRGWRKKAAEILEKEIPEQMLSDGMHFELSPMYHQRVCQILLSLVATGDKQWKQICSPVLPKALQALRLMRHPDGEIAFFNDAAMGMYPKPETLLENAQSLNIPLSERETYGAFALEAAGYYGFHTSNGDCLICDLGPIGPDYIPGHAHGDMLSFELSIAGLRIFVNAGIYDYERSEERSFVRSVRAHNTIEINDTDQCEFWAAFRVGRRGRAFCEHFDASGDEGLLEAWHNGYTRLPGSPRHQRRWTWKADALEVYDTIVSSARAKVTGRLRLHPACRLSKVCERTWEVRRNGIACRLQLEGDLKAWVEDSVFYPVFGQQEPTQVLCYQAEGKEIEWALKLNWQS